jgi:hypothetical protein
MHTEGTAGTPETDTPQAQADSVAPGASDTDYGRGAPSPVGAAILNLRAVVAEESEKRYDQSEPRGKLVVALAKHMAHRLTNLDPSHLCMGNTGGEPTRVVMGTIHVDYPMRAMWELFIPEAEQMVELMCMEWQLAQEVLQVRWL